MSLDWSDIGSFDADGFVVKVSAGTADAPDSGRVGISFAGNCMTSYIEVGAEELDDVIQLLNDASRRVNST